jgi:hypothetical protein
MPKTNSTCAVWTWEWRNFTDQQQASCQLHNGKVTSIHNKYRLQQTIDTTTASNYSWMHHWFIAMGITLTVYSHWPTISLFLCKVAISRSNDTTCITPGQQGNLCLTITTYHMHNGSTCSICFNRVSFKFKELVINRDLYSMHLFI